VVQRRSSFTPLNAERTLQSLAPKDVRLFCGMLYRCQHLLSASFRRLMSSCSWVPWMSRRLMRELPGRVGIFGGTHPFRHRTPGHLASVKRPRAVNGLGC
jgi:hypothetical protein